MRWYMFIAQVLGELVEVLAGCKVLSREVSHM